MPQHLQQLCKDQEVVQQVHSAFDTTKYLAVKQLQTVAELADFMLGVQVYVQALDAADFLAMPK